MSHWPSWDTKCSRTDHCCTFNWKWITIRRWAYSGSLQIVGSKLPTTTTYHPQTNGQMDRFNRKIRSAIRAYLADHPRDWDLYTDALMVAGNTQVHSTTGHRPFYLVLSRPQKTCQRKQSPKRISPLTKQREWCSWNAWNHWSNGPIRKQR